MKTSTSARRPACLDASLFCTNSATTFSDDLHIEICLWHLFCAGYTVMSGLRNADPKPGERVAILGLGGLGHLALQFSHALGLETWAITGQANKTAELKSMGAHEVLVTGDDLGKALRDAGGFDVILSTTNRVLPASVLEFGRHS